MSKEFGSMDDVAIMEGGKPKYDNAYRFADYVERVADEFGDKLEGNNDFEKFFNTTILVNTVLARPFVSLAGTNERRLILKSAGLSNTLILGLVTGQFILDHSVPNFLIAGYHEHFKNLTDNPLIDGLSSFLSARVTWGLGVSAIHGALFSYLRFTSSTNNTTLEGISAEEIRYSFSLLEKEINIKFGQQLWG